MIETENLVREMLSVIGYAQQTLALHPNAADKVQKYLASERVRLAGVVEERNENLSVIDRIVVY